MPGPPVDALETDPAPPARCDVAVIGAGMAGIAAALTLAERGLSVVVLEKGAVAAEQSSRNWGWCRVSRRDPREIPLAQEAMRQWDGMDRRVEGATGFRRAGILFGADTDKEVAAAEDWLALAAPHGVDSRMVGAHEAADLLPGGTRALRGALWTPSDGRAEPQKAVPAMARALRRRGGTVVERCAVRALDVAGGRVAGVVTERGRVAADAVVLAGGAWSRLFGLGAGLSLPQLAVQNTVVRTTAPRGGGNEGFGGCAWVGDFAIRRRADGGYTIANGLNNIVPIVPDSFRLGWAFRRVYAMEWRSLKLRLDRRFLEAWRDRGPPAADEPSVFERVRVLDPMPGAASAAKGMRAAQAFFPWLRGASVAQSWAGMIDATPDALPVISPVDAVPGLVVSTGYSGHGFGIGPGAGRLCADLVTGDAPVVDPAPFRLSRFTDGTPIRPMSPV